MKISFNSSKEFKETCTIYTKSNNINIIIVSEIDDIIEELFESLLQRYQK